MSEPSAPAGAVANPRATATTWLWRGTVAVLLLANLITLLTLLATRWWPFDLMANFAVQLGLIQIAGLMFCIARRAWRIGLATVVVMLINLVPVAGYYVGGQAMAAPAGASIRVMELNLWDRNDRIDLVEGAVRQEAPDLVAFAEVTPEWRERLEVLRWDYPYWVRDDRYEWADVLIVSRLPFQAASAQPLGRRGKTAVTATVCASSTDPGRCIDLLAVHLERPQGRYYARARNGHLDALANLVATRGADRAVLVGDFNLTPWSPYFPRLLAASGLRDGAVGGGVAPTWFSRWLPFGLPIDHILAGPSVTVHSLHVGPDVGSDHFPVIADLSF